MIVVHFEAHEFRCEGNAQGPSGLSCGKDDGHAKVSASDEGIFQIVQPLDV